MFWKLLMNFCNFLQTQLKLLFHKNLSVDWAYFKFWIDLSLFLMILLRILFKLIHSFHIILITFLKSCSMSVHKSFLKWYLECISTSVDLFSIKKALIIILTSAFRSPLLWAFLIIFCQFFGNFNWMNRTQFGEIYFEVIAPHLSL